MSEREKFPPFLPDHLRRNNHLWIGTSSPFNPQTIVVDGPSIDELQRAFEEKTKVAFTLESRTADMDEEEPNDKEGNVVCTVEELYRDEQEGFHFLLNCEKLPYGNHGGNLWVWSYENRHGGADIPV